MCLLYGPSSFNILQTELDILGEFVYREGLPSETIHLRKCFCYFCWLFPLYLACVSSTSWWLWETGSLCPLWRWWAPRSPSLSVELSMCECKLELSAYLDVSNCIAHEMNKH